MFVELPIQNVITWKTMIETNVEYVKSKEGLLCFENMRHEEVASNVLTYVGILKECVTTGVANKSQNIHGHIEKKISLVLY